MSTIASTTVQQSNSSRAFTAALTTNAALLAFEVGLFVVLKKKLWRIYSPRTLLLPPEQRATELPSGLWRWFPKLIECPAEDVIYKNGLDAYMFLRFLKMLIWIFLAFTILTFVVIIPIDTINVTSPLSGIERISWSNIVRPQDQPRYTAHIVMVYVLTFLVLIVIRREMFRFIRLRHQFLLDESHCRLPQTRTVLITTVPEDLANEQELRTFASFVPGGIDKAWLYRDTTTLNRLFRARAQACERLEEACAALLAKATNAWRKRVKARRKTLKLMKDEENSEPEPSQPISPSRELIDELVGPSERPSHRSGLFGLFGQKVDTVNWCKTEISRLNFELKEKREHIVKGKFLGSVFIRCNLQIGAHVLAQCVSHHEPLRMYEKWMEVNPKDIVWQNLDDGALEMTSRKVISWAALAGLIIAWAFPVGFIGTLSNLSDFCLKVNWLHGVCKASAPVQGIIQGVLPPALLAAMFALLPFMLRGLAWYECIPRYSLISISVYRRFFIFLLIHGFLIVTLSSGITRAIQDIIENPTHAVQKLANQLPGTSTFFLTYMITQGLAGAGSTLAQLGPLVFYYVRKLLVGRTPRQAYSVTFLMPIVRYLMITKHEQATNSTQADLGVILPRLSLLATITFAYSVLSPLINLLALISYIMYYISWKFLLLHVFDQPVEVETGGLYFPMAVGNLFVGLYIEQICLACLFFLKISTYGATAVAEGSLMIILLILTAFVHAYFNKSFNRIIAHVPMSLATKKLAEECGRAKQQRDADREDHFLFSKSAQRIRRRAKATTKYGENGFHGLRKKIKDVSYQRRSIPDIEESIALTEMPQPLCESSTELGLTNATRIGGESLASVTEGSVNFDERDEDEHAFDHPSTYADQPWIWIPKDSLGFSGVLIQELKDAGVSASDMGANMNEKGIVEATGGPPDEE